MNTIPTTHTRGPGATRRISRAGGPALTATGTIHTAFGLLAYADPLAGIARDGVLDAIGTHADRDAALWFLVTGLLLITLGAMATWAYARLETLPAFLGYSVLAIATGVAVAMPFSGWPLVAVSGALLLTAARTTGEK